MARPRNDRNRAWAEKVRERRLAHGWSQRELGDALGHSYRYIERIEQEGIVPPDADRRRLERKIEMRAAESAALRGTTLSDAFESLRQVTAAFEPFFNLATGRAAVDMMVTLHNPNDFKLHFEATLDGWINEKMAGELKIDGYAEPNADFMLQYHRVHEVLITRKDEVHDPCVLALFDYEIVYHPVFDASIEATKGARVRMISWRWPFNGKPGSDKFDYAVFWDDEFEEWQLASSQHEVS